MRNSIFILLPVLFCLLSWRAYSQTPISGVVNTYHKVIAVVPAKACVRVDDTQGLAVGNKVMIVQMKGAAIELNNNRPAYTDTISLNNAGNYELGTICNIKQDSVFLVHTILRNYTVADKVQLVKIPEYDDAIVTGTLQAKPWDNSTGKGGVLAISVTYNLFLNAAVSANSAGFVGGKSETSSGSCSNFFSDNDPYYDASNLGPQKGAYKGESVAELPMSYSGGKAAVANGGGGGNNHNNGGGGGANLTSGGIGGGNNSAAGCTVSNPGEGGDALSDHGKTKLFLGGGGGAGHMNSGGTTFGGGTGGGIIYIRAGTLVSNGKVISANGQNGGDAVGDGASGGGAGGTIIMNITAYADNPIIEAKGGNGGKEDDVLTDQRCYGEGGGGSGGVIYFKGAAPAGTISVAGGAKGLKVNSAGNCRTPVPAAKGVDGKLVTGYTVLQSNLLSPSCAYVLPATLLYFKATATGKRVNLQWQVTSAERIKEFVIERSDNEQNKWNQKSWLTAQEQTTFYTTKEENLAEGRYQYRLKIIYQDGAVRYSAIQNVLVQWGKLNGLSIYPNPATSSITILLPASPASELSIYDVSGKRVLHRTLFNVGAFVQQDVSTLSKGVYIVDVGGVKAKLAIQ